VKKDDQLSPSPALQGWAFLLMPRSNFAHRLVEYPDLIFPDEHAFSHRSHWHDFFEKRIGPTFNNQVIFEIGCNDAAFLATIAQKHPNTAFIGLDWKVKAIYDAAVRVSELELKNVALLRVRAQDIARIFGPDELDEIWIFHPDPCDREVELKNRLIAEPFLLNSQHVLRNGSSRICLKTDHAEYYEWTLKVLRGSAVRDAFQVAVRSSNYWTDEHALRETSTRLFSGTTTTFEDRFRRKKQPIFYVELRKRG
jgi:tRNA (guanine-N7-)-methyltransferase